MDPDNERVFTADGVEWRIRRDTGVRVGSSAQGYYPAAGRRGYHFHSSKGERRFLEMGVMELHDQDKFRGLTEPQLKELLARAKPE